MNYRAPVAQQLAALRQVADLDEAMGERGESSELVDAVLSESARFAENAYAPLNASGDREGARLEDGRVRLPKGFAEANQEFVKSGWATLAAPKDIGGQELPLSLAVAVNEQMMSANLSLSLGPILTAAAVESLRLHGDEALRRTYLESLVQGHWSATMCMTEPQAGSDVGALSCQANPLGDGSYAISGTKIFITWGDQDASELILHFVLARLPDAPAGSRGISLFLVPSRLVLPDGALGGDNYVECVSIEHKLGIRGSPTCTLSFGETGISQGWLIGEPDGGLRAMFAMMNPMRLSVAIQGVALAERAYQNARSFALDRVQSTAPDMTEPGAIIHHPDVQRMLVRMYAQTHAARLLAYRTAAFVDRGVRGDDHQAMIGDCLKPLAKLYCTEIGVEVANEAIQVFGGMGFIEETGIAQVLRDARIAPIYEGTNGIQANDFVVRKLKLPAVDDLIGELHRGQSIAQSHMPAAQVETFRQAVSLLTETRNAMSACENARRVLYRAHPFARLFASTYAAYALLLSLDRSDVVGGEQGKQREDSRTLARVFLAEILPAETARLPRMSDMLPLDDVQLAQSWFLAN